LLFQILSIDIAPPGVNFLHFTIFLVKLSRYFGNRCWTSNHTDHTPNEPSYFYQNSIDRICLVYFWILFCSFISSLSLICSYFL
jgi:hypothetical protein